HTRALKMVVASAVNDEGKQLFARKWNNDFAGLPVIDPTKQHRPTLSKTEIETNLAAMKPRYRMLVALVAGTGLRIGEALGVRVDDFSSDCRVLHIRRSVWRRKEQEPKTRNAIRVVDLPELLAQVLREY